MNTNSELFDLIKSLTSSEKRYFKLNASVQKGNKKYLKLFDLMDSQKVYNEKELKNLKGNEEVSRNFNFTKNYLGKLIFKSLLNFKNEKSIDAKLFNMLQRCRILFDKALFSQYFKTVKAGKYLAGKNERFSFLLEFNEIERQLTKKEELSGMNIEKTYDSELNVLRKIKTINKYKKSVSKLFKFARTKGLIRSEKDESELNDILSECEMDFEAGNMSVTAKERQLFAQSFSEELKGNFNSSFVLSKNRVKLISENLNVFDESLFDNHKDSVLSVINAAALNRKFKIAVFYLNKLKSDSGKSENDDINILLSELQLNLMLILNGRDIKNKSEYLKMTANILNEYKNKIIINTFNFNVYMLSQIYFFEKNYTESLKVFSGFSLEKNSGMSPFLEPYARMLLIMINFESGNYDLLKYMIPSAKKYLKSRNALHKTENSVLNYIAKVSKQNKNLNSVLLLNELYKDLTRFKKEKYEKNAFEYFDYCKWIKPKLNRN